MADVNDLKARLKGGGARSNRFEVQVNFPPFAGGGRETDKGLYLAKSTTLPASTLGVAEVFFRGRKLALAGDRVFNEWTITFLNDSDFDIRDAFEKWSNGMDGIESGIGLDNPSLYMFDIDVHQLDRNQSKIKSYKLKNAWPSEVSEIEVSTDSNDTIEEFTVTFQYTDWSSNTSI